MKYSAYKLNKQGDNIQTWPTPFPIWNQIYLGFIDYAKAFDYTDHSKLWKILQEMGIPDHLRHSWEICRQVKKQQLELFQIGKGVHQGFAEVAQEHFRTLL